MLYGLENTVLKYHDTSWVPVPDEVYSNMMTGESNKFNKHIDLTV